MSKGFFAKLAITNLRKNKSTYFPYILSCVGSIFAFFLLSVISQNKELLKIPGGETLQYTLNFGSWVVGIFSVVFIFYANSFLIKRRKKELGLYGILGLEKKHVSMVLFFETAAVGFASLIIGLLIGVLLGKLVFMLLMNIIKIPNPLHFTVSGGAVLQIVIFYAVVFLLVLIFNLLQVRLSNPISLLKGNQVGEKEPKFSWILVILGILSLGAAYAVAITVENPLDALFMFFLAVLLVIVGTFSLFTAGSIALLKALKKNKEFYYKSSNFVTVSGLMYRIKQNAAGLASICILCTMVLVVISSTVSLYIGQENIIKNRFYYQNEMITSEGQTDPEVLQQFVEADASQNQLRITDLISYQEHEIEALLNDGRFYFNPEKQDFNSLDEGACEMHFIPLEDYNRMEGKNVELADNQVLVFTEKGTFGRADISIMNRNYQVKEEIESLAITPKSKTLVWATVYLIMKDQAEISKAVEAFNQDNPSPVQLAASCVLKWNAEGPSENKMLHAQSVQEYQAQMLEGSNFNSMELSKNDWYFSFGGLFFLGIILGFLFMVATVLIIYFKQVSEGYEDHDRFVIMQKVGMDKKLVKKTIHKQILMVFFLPLLFAVIHTMVAFKMICRIMLSFSLTDTGLMMLCTISTIVIFAVIYFIVYSLTAKIYYKLVR